MQPIQPALFVSHGSPMTALATGSAFARDLRAFLAEAAPRAIVIVSAHWQTREVRVTSAERPQLIYDFGGFPPELFAVRYAARGDPALAREIVALLQQAGFAAAEDAQRGLDHGAWTPLVLGRPEADLPVVQVSLPLLPPAKLLELGRALAPLRERGVLLLGSGGAVHNLRRIDWNETAQVAPWAAEFDGWLSAKLEARDVESLARYLELAPHAREAAPTTDHFDPLFVVMGAGRPDDRPLTVHAGFQHGTLSMRSFALAPKL